MWVHGLAHLTHRGTAVLHTGPRCPLMPPRGVGVDPISISGLTGGPQQLQGITWEGVAQTARGGCARGSAAPAQTGSAVSAAKTQRTALGFWHCCCTDRSHQRAECPAWSLRSASAVGLLRAEEQQVPIPTAALHHQQLLIITQTGSRTAQQRQSALVSFLPLIKPK